MRFLLAIAFAIITACSACATVADAPPAPPPACADLARAAHAAHIAAGRELVDQQSNGESGVGVYWDRKSPTAVVELFVPASEAPPPESAKIYRDAGECALPTGRAGRHWRGEVPVVSEPIEAMLQGGPEL